jgi:hypothetical protein
MFADERVKKFLMAMVQAGEFANIADAQQFHLEGPEPSIGISLEKKLYRLKPEMAFKLYSEPRRHQAWVIIGDELFDEVGIGEWYPRPLEIRITRSELERFESDGESGKRRKRGGGQEHTEHSVKARDALICRLRTQKRPVAEIVTVLDNRRWPTPSGWRAKGAPTWKQAFELKTLELKQRVYSLVDKAARRGGQ